MTELLDGDLRASSGLPRSAALARSAAVRVLGYAVEIDLRDDHDVTVQTTIRLVTQDWRQACFLDCQDGEVLGLEVNGTEAPVDHDGHRLWLPALDGQVELVVRTRRPWERAGVGLHRVVDPGTGEVHCWTHLQPHHAGRLLPCLDQPDLKAPLDLVVLAPGDWVVVGNAPVLSRSEDGERWEFEPTPPLPTYLFALAAGHYEVVDGPGPVRLLCRRALRPHLDEQALFTLVTRGFEVLEQLFGSPHPFTKLDVVFAPEFGTHMENPGCITVDEADVPTLPLDARSSAMRSLTWLHEMSHLWFGDLVTMRWWDDLWLNEAFAVFTSLEALRRTGLHDPVHVEVLRASFWKRGGLLWDGLPSRHPVAGDVEDAQLSGLDVDGITYGKGAAALQQLHELVGAPAFWQAVRTYLAARPWGSATSADLLDSVRAVSGVDVSAWEQAWLRTAGSTVLRITDGVLHQTDRHGSPDSRPHLTDVAWYGERAGEIVALASTGVTLTSPSSSLPPQPAGTLLALPDAAGRGYARVALSDAAWELVARDLDRFPDQLVRTRLWIAAHLAVLAGERTVEQFVDLVESHCPAERDPLVLDAALAFVPWVLATTTGRRHILASTRAADTAHSAWLAERDPLCRRQWLRVWIASARGDRHRDLLLSLLTQQADWPSSLRWQVVVRAIALGAEPGIATVEAARGPSIESDLGAMVAAAAVPTTASKTAAFEVLIDPSTPAGAAGPIGSALHDLAHPELLVDLSERFFTALPSWQASKDASEVADLARAAFPRTGGPAAAARARGLADGLATVDPLRRVLIEEAHHAEVRG